MFSFIIYLVPQWDGNLMMPKAVSSHVVGDRFIQSAQDTDHIIMFAQPAIGHFHF